MTDARRSDTEAQGSRRARRGAPVAAPPRRYSGLVLAKLLYKPFAIVLGIFASRLAGKTFETTYERHQGTAAPNATTEDATWGQVLGSAALRATTFAVTTAAVDRLGAKAFRYVTGFWPGDKQPPPAKRLEARTP